MTENTRLAVRFYDSLKAMDRLVALGIADEAAADGLAFVESAVVPALERLGEDWERGAVALSQVYMGGRIAEDVVDRILPPTSPQRIHQPPMAIAVLEDYHLLGKRIVYSALRAAGFELQDFGGGLSPEALADKAAAAGIRILLVSTLMFPSALRVGRVRRLLNERGSSVKIVVGGAPFRFDARLWTDVGADAMGAGAGEAVAIVRRLMEEVA